MRALFLHLSALLCALAFGVGAEGALAQADDCKNRGELDTLYCDENKDLVADAPKDAKRWKNPGTLVFTYTPVEDAAVYETAFKPFLEYLNQCTGKRVVYFPVQSNAAEIEAMRAGRLHVGGFSTGPTGFAVNLAGAVPFAVKGNEKELQGYNLIMIVKKSSSFQKMGDLKGKKVAHTSPSSNSGHLAPQVLFPGEGLVPDKDYKILFSGGHGQSVKGVESGDYDAAPVASDVFNRMATRGEIKADEFRIIYRSPVFPTSSFAYAHDLAPDFANQLTKCFYDFRFPPEMVKTFAGADRFFPITYQKDWEVVRKIAEGTGTPYNRAAYDKESAREEAARKKKLEQKAKKN
ncbi:MAG: phosphate/phosphite/phosphonate ABC transporter substrate-binding protein [Betaproteobacteria bacterium]|nr:phosphate/phosphite/phosphonate ABC transporter substrate-binding protein [Betaproteobacteria bacterium]